MAGGMRSRWAAAHAGAARQSHQLSPPRQAFTIRKSFHPLAAMFALPCVGTLGPCLASAAAGCACSCCTAVTSQAMRSSARAAWSILFSFSLLVAWIARDFGSSLLKQLPCEWPAWRPRHCRGPDTAAPSGSGAPPPPPPPATHRPNLCALPAAAVLLCKLQGSCATSRAVTCHRTRGLGSRRCTESAWETGCAADADADAAAAAPFLSHPVFLPGALIVPSSTAS